MDLSVTTNDHIRSAANNSIPLKKPSNINDQKKKLANATKEMEAFFLYYVLKAMRKTVPQSNELGKMGLGGDMGKDIYTQIFDEELSKKMAGNGDRSIASLLYRSLERVLDKQNGSAGITTGSKESLPKPQYLKIQNSQQQPIKLDHLSKVLPAKSPINSTSVAEIVIQSGRRLITDDPEGMDGVSSEAAGKIHSSKASATESSIKSPVKPQSSGFKEIIQNASEKYRLHPSLLESIIEAESNGNPKAVSSTGAKGLMQLADTTASDMGVKDVFDPQQNVEAGAKYLRILIDRFKDIKKALAAYNAGPGKVVRYEGIPPYEETRNYVKNVLDSIPKGTTYYE